MQRSNHPYRQVFILAACVVLVLNKANLCSAQEARHFYQRCLYEEKHLGIEWVHDSSTLPLVNDPESLLADRTFSQVDYDLHNLNSNELAIRATFLLMPDTVRLRVREGNTLVQPRLLKEYNREQIEWMMRAKHFLAERVHHDPDSLELRHEYFSNGTPVYFKIREVLLYPERFETAHVLHLSELLHDGQTVQSRLYGDPEIIPAPSPAVVAA